MHVVELLPPDDRLILVGHGMGGLAISLAMDKFPKKIAAAAFVAAYMPGPDFPFSHIIQQVYILSLSYFILLDKFSRTFFI